VHARVDHTAALVAADERVAPAAALQMIVPRAAKKGVARGGQLGDGDQAIVAAPAIKRGPAIFWANQHIVPARSAHIDQNPLGCFKMNGAVGMGDNAQSSAFIARICLIARDNCGDADVFHIHQYNRLSILSLVF
jgi:hypothetical protein